MPWVEFEPTISVFKRANTFHALDHTATLGVLDLTYYWNLLRDVYMINKN
jgi:hypothetical protein